MRRRLGIAGMAVGAWVLTLVVIAPVTPALAAPTARAAQVEYSFKDNFSSNQYNGNSGTDAYDGPWWESLDWGGSNKGAVTVVEDGDCPRSSCARIGGETEFWGTGLARRADIEEAATATLKFKYRMALDEPATGRLEVAVFDGWNWTTLDSLDLAAEEDDVVHTKSYDVLAHASRFFTVGFFAYGEWNGAVFIDDVKVFGLWEDASTTITDPPTSSTTTTVAPTTTTSTVPSSTTTTTAPPATTTTTVAPPTTTSRPPTVTTRPPTTEPPATAPPPTTLLPTTTTTTRPPSTELPLTNDERYKDKGDLAFFAFDDGLATTPGDLATMPGEFELPKPGPVTQIMASVTVTAVTIRSHLLSAIALGLLIAAAAVIGLGRRGESR